MKKLLILIISCLFLLTSCEFVDIIKSKVLEELLYENGNNDYEYDDSFGNYNDDDDYTNDSLMANGPDTTDALPSIGDVNVLVVPVNFISKNKTQAIWNEINSCFNGTESQTGWESVKTYYQKSSYGKLNLSFTVTDWYTPYNSMSYYENYNEPYDDGSTTLMREILDYYDSYYDYSNFDSDNDNYIDGVWMVYNCPVDTTGDSDMWWAFSYVNQTDDKWDGLYAKYYAFAGYDFLHEDRGLKIDTTCMIHETGHMFGLDDYYNYKGDQTGGVYGLDMMDEDIGDHGPISKILLGWVTPIVVTESKTISIDSFESSGDAILITNHELKTIYDEYFLIDYYTGTGVNNYHKPFGTNARGVRVYHVNAHQNINSKGELSYNGGDYSTAFKYDNTDTSIKFVKLLRQSPTNNSVTSYSSFPKYLFTPSSKQFGYDVYTNYTYANGSKLNFKFKVTSQNTSDTILDITIS